jgi:hypothetical protein
MDYAPPPYTQTSSSDPTEVQVVRDTPPRPTEPGTLELGLGSFLLAGGPAGGYVGLTPFVMADLGRGVFLRPALVLGEANGTPVRSLLGGGRVDTCARIHGNYAAGRGIQLDLCGGVEGGLARVDGGTSSGDPLTSVTLPYLEFGPSVDLRAELGQFAVTLRAVAGYQVLAIRTSTSPERPSTRPIGRCVSNSRSRGISTALPRRRRRSSKPVVDGSPRFLL